MDDEFADFVRECGHRLYRVAFLLLHTDWWRTRRWRERPVAVVPERSTGTDLERATTDRYAVTKALRILSPRERSVIVHRYSLDLTEQQTARELGISAGTYVGPAALIAAGAPGAGVVSGSARWSAYPELILYRVAGVSTASYPQTAAVAYDNAGNVVGTYSFADQ